MFENWSTIKKLIWLKYTLAAKVKEILYTLSGTPPLLLQFAVNKGLKSLTQYGVTTQSGTPTPSEPKDIVCNNGALKYGPAGNNLVNMVESNIVLQQYISNGEVHDHQDFFYYSPYIPVKPNTKYTLSTSSPFYSIFIDEYAADKTCIWSSGNFPETEYPDTVSHTCTTKEDTRFVRFSCNINRTTLTLEKVLGINWMFNEGEAMPYEPSVDGIAPNGPEVLTLGAVVPDSRLPNGYTPLEYVQNEGTGYIDTGIVFNTSDINVEVDCKSLGEMDGAPKMAWGFMGNQSNLPRWGFGTYNNAWLGSPNVTVSKGWAEPVRHTFLARIYKVNNTLRYTGSLDGETIYDSTTVPSDDLYLANDLSSYLFARNNAGNAGNNFIGKIYGFKVTQAETVIHNLVPCKDTNNVVGFYDVVTQTFMGAIGTLTGKIKTVETQTATAENLFAVGNYKDEQDIISGAVTRRVGIKVFDGTESVSVVSGTLRYVAEGKAVNTQVLCSHFDGDVNPAQGAANQPDLTVKGHASSGYIYFKYTEIAGADNQETVSNFKAYLAAQYAAGTPVIVLYPLAEEVTEQATPQALTTQEGDNALSIVSDVLPNITVEYYGVEVDSVAKADSAVVDQSKAG